MIVSEDKQMYGTSTIFSMQEFGVRYWKIPWIVPFKYCSQCTYAVIYLPGGLDDLGIIIPNSNIL